MKIINLIFFSLIPWAVEINASGTNGDDNVSHVERYEDIIKSPNDERLYRGLKLHNNMKVLLISDPTTDMSAASMTIGVGSMNDPEDLPGLAHLLEHMIFFGSKKYPQSEDFSKFLSEHGGTTNAKTDESTQQYFFEINYDYLAPALDRFIQFFLEPLIPEIFITGEVLALNAEHEEQKYSGSWGIIQLRKMLSNVAHPYKRFSAGSSQTLNTSSISRRILIHKKLLEFHSELYSSNVMYLAVLGKENLDELEEMVTSLFEKVEDKHVPKMMYSFEEHPWGAEQLQHIVLVVPVFHDIKILKLEFPVPSVNHQYKIAPQEYVVNLLETKTEGGLISILRKKDLCRHLLANYTTVGGISFFQLALILPVEAAHRANEVVAIIFQYIYFLKTRGIQEWIFEEHRKLSELNFLFKDKESPFAYVQTLGRSMADDYPIREILTFKYLRGQWTPSPIETLISYLRPDNMNIFLIDKIFEGFATRTECWYGTKYMVDHISADLIEEWNELSSSSDFQLPSRNEFIPENFYLYPANENEPKDPYVILESSVSRIWFKKDNEFNLPKLNIQFQILSPVWDKDPYNHVLSRLYAVRLKQISEECTHTANLAGIEWEISSTRHELLIRLFGYNDKMELFLNKLFLKMSDFRLDKDSFEEIRTVYMLTLKNFETEEPKMHSMLYLSYLLNESSWTIDELLIATSVLTHDDWKTFTGSHLFSKIFVQGLIYGNCSKKKAIDIASTVDLMFRSSKGNSPKDFVLSRELNIMPDAEKLFPRPGQCHAFNLDQSLEMGRMTKVLSATLSHTCTACISFLSGRHYVYERNIEFHSASAYYGYYQCGIESIFDNTVLDLFSLIVEEPCFDILRGQDHLGYSVSCGIRRVSGVQGFFILVQSVRHPLYIDSRAEMFLGRILEMLNNMTDAEFDAYKIVLARRLSQKPGQMKVASDKYWYEITNRYYNFDRDEMQIMQLDSVKKTDVLNFMMEKLHASSRTRRKLSVHAISILSNPSYEGQSDVVRIRDVTVFKSNSYFFPLPSPYINIAPLGSDI